MEYSFLIVGIVFVVCICVIGFFAKDIGVTDRNGEISTDLTIAYVVISSLISAGYFITVPLIMFGAILYFGSKFLLEKMMVVREKFESWEKKNTLKKHKKKFPEEYV